MQLITSYVILVLAEAFILILFNSNVKTIGFIKVRKGLEFLGIVITPLQICMIIVSILLLVLFYVWLKKTKLGKAMRAVSDNKEIAEIVGISAERIYSWTFIIGSAIAGVAGILVSLEQNLEPMMGTSLIIKGFVASIIGGIGSVPGAIVGSFLLGIVENFGVWFLPISYKNAIAFIIVFIFLLFRPNGILGIKKGDEK